VSGCDNIVVTTKSCTINRVKRHPHYTLAPLFQNGLNFMYGYWYCVQRPEVPLSHTIKKSIAPSHKLQHSNSVPGKGGDSSVMASVSDVEIMFWSERSYLISWTEWTIHTSNHTEVMW